MAHYTVRGEKGGGKGGGGGSAPRAAREAPNTLQSAQTARIIDLISEGEIGGLVDGLKSVYFEDTAVENDDGSFNFNGVEVTTREGTADQTPVSGFPEVERVTPVGIEVVKATPIVRTITDTDVAAVRVSVRIPALFRQDTQNGDVLGTSVQIAFDLQPDGGSYTEVVNDTISGKTNSPYVRTYRIELTGSGPWNLRMRRITNDAETLALNNKTFFSNYIELIDANLSYPNSAYVALTVDARQFGDTIPSRSYEVNGIKIQIPSNYDPDTREYDGIWDGTFTTGITDNPAWILYALLTDEIYGLGQFISASQVDTSALYTISQYCDELVDDGFGGTEPRFTFNGVINDRREAFDVLNTLAAAFQGMVFWGNGLIGFAQDSPKDPVKLVTAANVVDGEFVRKSTSDASRFSVALVTWNDPDDSYRAAVATVEDPTLIDRFGWRTKEVAAIGTNSKGQAHRLGRWILDSNRYETETITYKASWDHVDLLPGDIVKIADPAIIGTRRGGRVVSATTTSVTMDAAVELPTGVSFTLAVILDDGTLEEKTVSTASGQTVSTVTVSEAFSSAPSPSAVFILAGDDAVPETFRVLGVAEIEPNIFEVTAVEHDPDKRARVEDGLVLDNPAPTTILPSGTLAAPNTLNYQEFLFKTAGGSIKSAVAFSWQQPSDARAKFYEVQVKPPDTSDWRDVATITGTSIDIEDTRPGVYEFRVRTVDSLGRVSAYVTLSAPLLGLRAPPSSLQNLSLSRVGGLAVLRWDIPPELDVQVGGRIKFRHSKEITGASLTETLSIGNPVPGNATQAVLPLQRGTYFAIVEDSSGVVDENPANISTRQTQVIAFTTLDSVQAHPSFGGAKDNVVAVDGELKLDSAENIDDVGLIDDLPQIDYTGGAVLAGTYTFLSGIDLGSVKNVRLTADLAAIVQNVEDLWDEREGDIDDWGGLIDGATGVEADCYMEIRETEDDPSGSPTWSAWERLESAEFNARAFQARLQLTSTAADFSVEVSEATLTADEVV